MVNIPFKEHDRMNNEHIADEPTSHLDSDNIEKFLSLLFDLKEKGTTIILATHDQRLSACADVVLHIKDGIVRKE